MLGQELLQSLQSVPAAQNAAAMLRHSERHPITDSAKPMNAELTENGIVEARAMGGRITGFAHLRLYHSPVKRCQQTAECVAEGASKAGLHVEFVGPSEDLGVYYIRDLAEAGRMHLGHGDDFIRLWFSGQVPESVVLEPAGIARRKLAHVSACLAEPAPRGRRLDLHFSHDWNIIVLRELLLGVRHEEAGWLNFLDGVAFSMPAPDTLTALWRETSRSRSLPWDDFVRRA
jgi:broad specificity phosphatase PhoE